MKRYIILFLMAIITINTPVFAQSTDMDKSFPDSSLVDMPSMDALYDTLLKKFVADGLVDYASLKNERKPLDEYLNHLAQIKSEEFKTWSQNKQLAYLINLYNAATLQLILDNYPLKSIKEIGHVFKGPWDQPVVQLFGKTISLDNLEHDIIRKEYTEPRIHMALVCAAKGCPILRNEPYKEELLNQQLDDQSRIYLASPIGMRQEGDTVYLSSIFKWYGDDFPSVIGFAEQYTGKKLEHLKLRWIKYDWALNTK